MNFTWDKKIINNNLNKILKAKEIDKDYSLDDCALDLYRCYIQRNFFDDYYIDVYEKESNVLSNCTDDDIIAILKEKLVVFDNYMNKYIPKNYINKLYDYINIAGYSTLLEDDKIVLIKENDVSCDYLRFSIYNVYDTIGPNFRLYLDYIMDNRLIYLLGIDKKKKISCTSSTYPDYINDMGFITINNDRISTKISTLNHEIAHSIMFNANKKLFSNYELDSLVEVHSIYMSLYTDLYFYSKTRNICYLESLKNYLIIIKENIGDVYILVQLSNLFKNKDDPSIEEVKEYLYNNSNININMNIRDFLKLVIMGNDIKKNFKYVLGLFLAYHMLIKDEEKSKYLFNKSFFADTKSIYTFLRSIEFKPNDFICNGKMFDIFYEDICYRIEEEKKKIRK